MSRDYKKQDEKDRQGQGAGRPGADERDDSEQADTPGKSGVIIHGDNPPADKPGEGEGQG